MQDPMEENNGGNVDSLAGHGVVAFCRGEKAIISVGFEFTSGNLETWQSMGAFHGVHHYGQCQLPSVLVNTMDPNSPSHVR